MLLKSQIERCIHEQREDILQRDLGHRRLILPDISLTSSAVQILTGIRRCGKSTLLNQVRQAHDRDTFAYLNFEDHRIFDFALSDFAKLDELIAGADLFFFDEIQNVPDWEVYIRQLHDRGSKICLTGSNASMLSLELGTRLTGRHLQREVFPFCYQEYCDYLGLACDVSSLTAYMETGGFPNYVDDPNPEYLQQLVRDIIYRDIVVRYGIRNSRVVEEICLYLLSNVGKEYSLNRLRKAFAIGSASSVADYLSWMQDSYLLYSLPRFSYSAKAVSVNPKKIYAIDTGLIAATSLSYSDDYGRLLENAVFMHLRRSTSNLYYYKDQAECDFLIKEGRKITTAIQVCARLHSDNLDREVNGLVEAMDALKIDKGLIITLDQSDHLQTHGKSIEVLPAYEYLAGADEQVGD